MSDCVPQDERGESDFERLMADIEAEARAEGPEAVAQLEAFTRYFAAASRELGRSLAARRAV